MGGEGCGDEGVCVVGWGGEEEVGFDLILIYVCDLEWSEVREGGSENAGVGDSLSV